jgi:hypothetical protein
MQFPLLALNSLSSELSPEDDVDRLFKKLQRREPPANILQQILNRIRHLPPERIYQLPAEPEKTNTPDTAE